MESFLTFINQHGLDLRNNTTLLTVSGGVDSIVMAHLFYTMGFKAAVAHCNFGLRREESDADEQFVRDLSVQYGFDFFTKKFATKEFANKKSISTQMAARDLRYEWFEELRQKRGYRWVATAHHANDSFETILLNLTRGTGLPGLIGIAGVKGFLMRPLLYVSKAEILEYASKNSLEWREDRSNDTDDYKRNLLRHQAIPVFRQLNPAFETTFKPTSEKLKSANALLTEFLEQWKAKVMRQEEGLIKISIADLHATSEPIYRLWHILENYGFTYSQVHQIFQSAGGISGKMFFSKEYALLIDREDLILKRAKDRASQPECVIENFECFIRYGNQTITFSQIEGEIPCFKTRDASTILVSHEKLVLPLKIRKWQEGDTFHPFGMGGKRKKASDLFTDLKLNIFQKEEVSLLINGNGDIIWVIGIRSDERFRMGEESVNLVAISIKAEPDPKKF